MHFRNYFLKLKMPTFYYSDRIRIIICLNNTKSLPRFISVKFLLNLSASANTFAPVTPSQLPPKIL